MYRKPIGLYILPVALAACVSVPVKSSHKAPKSVPQQTAAVAPSQARIDAAEYRRTLEEAYDQIVKRASGAKAVVADADAALSMAIPDHRTISGAISYFSTDLHDSIQTSIIRSAQYKPMIDPILDEYHLPRGLAYLPVIESAYIPTLTSRAGAHGIWQFMPSTAREYGLRVDWWVDERANPEKSTRAAAAFLRDLYTRFGDWSLVLAAYNAGPGRIERAIDQTGASTFWELLDQKAIPKETRGYVPTFYATLVIVSDPATYGFQVLPPQAGNTKQLKVAGPVSLGYIASVSGANAQAIEDLNPEYRRGIVPPGVSTIRVPEKVAPFIQARADRLRFDDPEMQMSSYTLRPGDSLANLARMMKVSKETLLAMNDLGSNDRVGSGDTIYLPVRKADLSTMLQPQSSSADRYYVVAQGDTIYSIAKRNGLSVEELVDLNRLGGDNVIHPGDRLKVTLQTTMTGGM